MRASEGRCLVSEQRKGFPILRPWNHRGALPNFVDWAALNREQANINHGQTLERLAERGGLSPDEIVANIERRKWKPMKIEDALAAISAHTFDVERAEGGL